MDGSSYVLLPNNTSTLKTRPKEEQAQYNISIEQLPQTRLIHLSSPVVEPGPGFGLKSLPADRVSVSCSERDSPIQNLHNISSESHVTSSLCDAGESWNSMSKSETVSTLSMSSLERRKSRYAELDFEKVMHTRKRHQDMFQDLNRKLQHSEKDRDSPPSDCKDKPQTPSERAWEGVQKTHSPPSWVRKDLEPLPASPLQLQAVEWEKTSATIPLVGQEMIDLQTE
ncbi:hypothetical protein JZ751_000459, partial [Albula glossodonta]